MLRWRWGLGAGQSAASKEEHAVVSRIFRTFNLAERHPALGHAVMAPLICWSFSNSMFRYLLLDHAVPAMWRSLAAAVERRLTVRKCAAGSRAGCARAGCWCESAANAPLGRRSRRAS